MKAVAVAMPAIQRVFSPERIRFWLIAMGVAMFTGLLAMVATISSGTDRDEVTPLDPIACFASFAQPRSVHAVMAAGKSFSCGEQAVMALNGAQFWVRVDRDKVPLPHTRLHLEADSAPVGQWTIAYRDGSGAIASRQLTAEQSYRHWTAGARLSLPLTEAESNASQLYIAIDRPWARGVYNSLELRTARQAQHDKLHRMVPFAIYAGITLMPIVYSLMLFIAMGHRFMLLHALSAACLLLYTVSASSLLLFFVPEVSPWARTLTSYASLSLAVSFACFFAVDFLERDVVRPGYALLMRLCGYLMLANAAFVVTAGPWLPFTANNIYHAVYLAPIVCYVLLIGNSLRRGSTAAWYLLGGWALTCVSAVERILRGLDIYVLPPEANFSIYIGFVFEVVVTACGVAMRVMSLRRERDAAKAQERNLQRMAETDGLTGLCNRSRFDRDLDSVAEGTLVLVDVDHFKSINDTLGHQMGDDVLRAMGQLMARCEGPPWNATAYRVGGEEFALLLATGDRAPASAFAERLRLLVERELSNMVRGMDRKVTISLGVYSSYEGLGPQAYADADRALYASKQQGRNRTTLAQGMVTMDDTQPVPDSAAAA